MKKVLLFTGMSLVVLLALTFLLPNHIYAENPACDDEGINFCDLENITIPRLNNPTLARVILNLLSPIYSAAGLLLLIYLVVAGYQYLTSGGDPGKIAAARGKITNGLLGLAIVFFSYWIVQLVAIFLGLDRIMQIFPWAPPLPP